MTYQYHVLARRVVTDDADFVRSFVKRAEAVAFADALVEEEGWWSAFVHNARRHVVYSVFAEPVMVARDGRALPLKPNRALIVTETPTGERTHWFKEDDEYEATLASLRRNGCRIIACCTIRETTELLHAEFLNLADTWAAPPF